MPASRPLSAGRYNLSFHRPPSGLALYPQIIGPGDPPRHSSDSSQCPKREQLRAPKAPCKGSPPPACLRSGHFLARFKPPGRKRATRTSSGSSTAAPPKPSAP
ncbi:hypothetical protein NDU88_008908 [Pleurodeles waltl]|uniref:Uncharacterized protein n=1 Tax=Pleurodeles waltl TaxID=8319 RepID=A0AAV7RY98_PLEWA|nr:hypothetical protein NDU88_008908 [Pleurodeles waltl]